MHEHFMGDELPHTVRVGRNIPGWMGEQMGLRSGGHAVAIGLSIVGAVVVAYAGPESVALIKRKRAEERAGAADPNVSDPTRKI